MQNHVKKKNNYLNFWGKYDFDSKCLTAVPQSTATKETTTLILSSAHFENLARTHTIKVIYIVQSGVKDENSFTHLYTWVERGTVPKNTTQCPRPGLEPGPLDPETSALTMRPTRLRHVLNVIEVLFTCTANEAWVIAIKTKKRRTCRDMAETLCKQLLGNLG